MEEKEKGWEKRRENGRKEERMGEREKRRKDGRILGMRLYGDIRVDNLILELITLY